jgi:hypothetical protein
MFKKIVPLSEVKDYIETIIGSGLEKDLHETEFTTEEVCERCHGTGIVLTDNPFGLSEEKTSVRFPYRHQSFTFCPDCFNGVRKRCKLCGELVPRGQLTHNCKQMKEIEKKKKEDEEKKRVDALPWTEVKEELGNINYYSEFFPYNEGYFMDFDEFFDAIDEEEIEGRPEYCFGVTEIPFTIDAESVVENACDDSYEDAYDHVGNIRGLQKSIDEWIEKNGPGSTFVYNKNVKVRIPWERYKG